MSTTIESNDARREERRFLLRLIVLIAAGIGVFVLLTMFRGSGGNSQFPRVQLADGTWLVVRGVTTGTKHSIEIPYPFEIQLSRWTRSYTNDRSTDSNRMMIWVTHENHRGEVLGLDWFARCQLVTGDGEQTNPREYHRQVIQGAGSTGAGVGSTGFSDATKYSPSKPLQMAIVNLNLPLQRPREGMMTLDVFDASGQIVAQLKLPYPAISEPIPDDWEPDPLPATRTVGDLTVTLDSVKYSSYPGQSNLSVQPQLKFLHGGQPSTTWSGSPQISDPLGNSCSAWDCDLPRSEKAWKLKVSLAQSASGRFLPSESRRLPLIPLTPAKQLKLLTKTETVNDVPVSIVGMGGAGPFEFTLPQSFSHFKSGEYKPGQYGAGISTRCSGTRCDVDLTSGHPFVVTGDPTPGQGEVVELVFRDQAGELLKRYGLSGTDGVRFWYFEPAPTTTDIEIEIICQKLRTVEFLIQPPKPEDINQNQ